MNNRIISLLIFTFLFFLETYDCIAQNTYFCNHFYVFGTAGKISSVPVSYLKQEPIENYSQCSSNIYGFGIGYTVSNHDIPLFIDIEFDHSSGKFSDWRVNNRSISYNVFGFNVGYIPIETLPAAVFASFGGGWLAQSQFVNENNDRQVPGSFFSERVYEYMQEIEYPIFIGIGVKLAIVKHVILRGEYKYLFKGSSNSDYNANGVTVVDVSDSDESSLPGLGNRLSVGLELYL